MGDVQDEVQQLETKLTAAEAQLERVLDWSHRFGKELVPHGQWSDSFGDGMRAAKQQVVSLLLSHAPSPAPAPELFLNVDRSRDPAADRFSGVREPQPPACTLEALAERFACIAEAGRELEEAHQRGNNAEEQLATTHRALTAKLAELERAYEHVKSCLHTAESRSQKAESDLAACQDTSSELLGAYNAAHSERNELQARLSRFAPLIEEMARQEADVEGYRTSAVPANGDKAWRLTQAAYYFRGFVAVLAAFPASDAAPARVPEPDEKV